MKLITTILVVSITTLCFGQLSTGDKLRNDGNLTGAINAYTESYKEDAKNKTNTYNLACAYALTYQIDSAYHYLNIALEKDHTLWALSDPDLISMFDDERWKTVIELQLEKYQKENGALKDPEYAIKLLTIIKRDQGLDYYLDQAKKDFMKKGKAPFWYYPLGDMKEKLNQSNFLEMQKLLEEHGWPKYSTVGKLAADAPLLVINHHPSDEVRKQYLDQVKNACLSGEGSCMEYAKIQDRILVNDDLPQIYGMQFRYNKKRKLEPFPIQNPEHVDFRRKKIGLETLNVYLKRKIDYDWNIKQSNP